MYQKMCSIVPPPPLEPVTRQYFKTFEHLTKAERVNHIYAGGFFATFLKRIMYDLLTVFIYYLLTTCLNGFECIR